jgi:hypothetical protein
MTDLIAQSCGCEHKTWMGQKRPERCEHGNRFLSIKQAKNGGSSLARSTGPETSQAQRDKVRFEPCLACGKEAGGGWLIDPAHFWPRRYGGCEHPLCVGPLCRHEATGEGCHRQYDEGKLDIHAQLVDRGYWAEMAHAIEAHEVSPLTLTQQLTGEKYFPQRQLDELRARIVELEGSVAA